MINNFISKTNAGLYCEAGDFYIDPRKAVHRALVSHAHGDHAVPTPGLVYCTFPTQSFMQHRSAGKAQPQFKNVDFGNSFYLNNVKITYYPAGHMLGSAQILMECNGEKYLYTGDFKTQSDASCEKFQYVTCDHLITETTFASPEFLHPDPVLEIKSLANENTRVMIGAYALGKAQRLTQMLTTHFPDRDVFIHPDLEVYHKLYEKHGISLGNWKSFQRSEFENANTCFFVVPPMYFGRYTRNINLLKVFATGWKKSFYRCDRILPVSDHADWPGVLEMIRQSNAKNIYTVHGNGKFLKEFLRDKMEVKIIS